MAEEWERPQWVRKLRDFLNDDIIEFIAQDGSEDAVTDRVTDAAMAVVCNEYGHYVEQDQCGISAHRFCLWCFKAMPDIELGNYRPENLGAVAETV
jgi:hypothetical protein